MALSDSLYLGLTAVLLVVSVVGLSLLGPGGDAGAGDGAADEIRTGLTGERYTVPAEDLYTLCLGSCIPPLDSARYERAANVTWLDPADEVVSVTVDGETYAFPVPVLRYHGVLNTRIGGRPVAMSYSPHSAVARAFVRRVSGSPSLFRHAGVLYNGDMVMRDAGTGSRWSQFTAAAIRGPAVPERLETVESHVVRWGIWHEAHPGSRVLSRDTGIYNASRYADDPYHGYRRSDAAPVDAVDDRLPPKTLVYGAVVDDEAVAYRDVTVRDLGMVQDTIDGTPVLLVQDEDRGTVHGYIRRAGGETLDFTLVNGTLRDGTGTRWTLDGRAVAGPRSGTTLPSLGLTRAYWFTWSAFHPDTAVHGGE